MKTSRVLLSGLVIMLMMPAFADDNDGQQRGQGKREGNKQQTATVTQETVTNRSPNAFMGFKSMPLQTRPQTQIQNAPVGSRPNNSAPHERFQTSNPPLDSNNHRDRNIQEQNRRNDYSNNERYQVVNSGFGSDGYIRGNNTNLTNRGYVRADNSNLSSDGYIRINQTRTINQGNAQGSYIRDRDNQGWRNNNRAAQYRMPYRQGYSDRYRVHYVQSWPTNYGWRSHGWSRNYREADPYWFAVITSIALAQAWSDAEVAQAINDNNLRQQLIYDEDIRQQMIASGYPANQVYYSSYDYGNDPNVYPRAGYDNPYDLNTTYPPQTQNGYYPPTPPTSSNPNSPLYNGIPLASGDQVANRNANQNALFFCNGGNKQQTLDAFRQVQSIDVSVWKTIESYNKCRSWAVLP